MNYYFWLGVDAWHYSAEAFEDMFGISPVRYGHIFV